MISGTAVVNTFSFNGTALSHQPTEHGWNTRDVVGIDGNGVAVMVAPREYELKWDYLNTEEFNEIYTYYLAQGVTGSVVSSLPRWNFSPYTFYAYTGTILREPEYAGWFENFYTNVRLLIVRINGT